jgi:hypothetical protein
MSALGIKFKLIILEICMIGCNQSFSDIVQIYIISFQMQINSLDCMYIALFLYV